jgi:hypothetical protein
LPPAQTKTRIPNFSQNYHLICALKINENTCNSSKKNEKYLAPHTKVVVSIVSTPSTHTHQPLAARAASTMRLSPMFLSQIMRCKHYNAP